MSEHFDSWTPLCFSGKFKQHLNVSWHKHTNTHTRRCLTSKPVCRSSLGVVKRSSYSLYFWNRLLWRQHMEFKGTVKQKASQLINGLICLQFPSSFAVHKRCFVGWKSFGRAWLQVRGLWWKILAKKMDCSLTRWAVGRHSIALKRLSFLGRFGTGAITEMSPLNVVRSNCQM